MTDGTPQPSSRLKISETILRTGRLDAMKSWYAMVLGVVPFFEHVPPAGTRPLDLGGHLGPGSTMWVRCSDNEDALRAESYGRDLIKLLPFKVPFLRTLVMKRLQRLLVNPSAFTRPEDVDRLRRAIDSFREDKAEDMAGKFVADGSWQCATLVRLKTQTFADDPAYRRDELPEYLPAKNVRRWQEVTALWASRPDDFRRAYRDAYPRQLALTRLLSDAGVRMIVGTDGGSYLGPGLTLRQEFRELSDAGIAPLMILQMATVNAAAYLHREDSIGLMAESYDADMVLLHADPTDRVENLHAIAGVVRGGFHHSRRALDAMKARVATTRGYLN